MKIMSRHFRAIAIDRGGAVLDGPEAGYKVTYTQADAEAVKAH